MRSEFHYEEVLNYVMHGGMSGMRSELKEKNGQRRRFRALVERFGTRENWH